MYTNLLLITAFATSALAVSVPGAVSSSSFIPDVQWKVSGFTRPCTATICTYNFTISVIPSSGPIVNIPCLYNDSSSTPPTSSTPQTHSYSALSCSSSLVDGKPVPSPWQVNWGYNPNGDFAVMTIVDTEKGNDAFFGWNQITSTSTTTFEDKGPNTVYKLGTFT
ncbi:uncharacterized protein EAE98_008645 [Botrytis deweyae]|uniref:Ig-like domain-containing protein n=1 Tax=Botrytis deweyae TaxID=2478750 RepID=A0ABQ7IE38_9HELO|nr:uncharacterized protein EAE98_008645 [Botrytis deweyae]KAF7921219.1 hypothetical protein EAE98_008645 [Botrytis deweyae]